MTNRATTTERSAKMKSEIMEFCHTHGACSEAVQWLGKNKIDSLSGAYEQCQRGDWLLWMLGKADKINKKQAITLACQFARRVLPIFQRKYPKDDRPLKAIEAAEAWVENPTEANLAAAARAAWAARAAARAAEAAAWTSEAAAREAELKSQAEAIRKAIPNPWKE